MPFRCIVYYLIIVGFIYAYCNQNQKCKDAGGIYTPNICVNPSAVIELD
jgi:hypothetical protein